MSLIFIFDFADFCRNQQRGFLKSLTPVPRSRTHMIHIHIQVAMMLNKVLIEFELVGVLLQGFYLKSLCN